MARESKETTHGSCREEDFGCSAIDKIIDAISSIVCCINFSAKKAILRLNICSFLADIYCSILSYMIIYCNEVCGFVKSSGRYAMFYDQVSGCGGESTPNQAAA
jgi:hypothetical protein